MASQITATLPTLDFPREVDYPTQEDWAAFSAAAELNFGILGSGWSTQMQLWKTQANAMSTELNTNADIAQGLANYQGDWISQGYTLGQTVSVSGVYYICKLTHATGQNPTTGGSIYWNLALGNWSLKVDTNMSGYTSKTTPVDADLIPLSDSVSSFGIKKLSWSNLKATLKTYFDSLYMSLTGNQTIGGDKGYTGKLLVVSDSGAIGYGAGAGGVVTQLTSKDTSVTLNKPTGQIAMNNASLATNTWVGFSVINSLVTASDTIIVNAVSGSTVMNLYEVKARPQAGSIAIDIRHSYASSLTDAMVIKFTVIKGANS